MSSSEGGSYILHRTGPLTSPLSVAPP